MANILPPPPVNDKPGSFAWMEWYRQLRTYVATSGSVPWYIVDFAGSNITDIVGRDHGNLQGLQGGAAGERYHLTADQHSAISNSLSLYAGTSSIVLPTTPTIFNPAVTVDRTDGITINTSTGEVTFVNGGTYNMQLTFNASTGSGVRRIYLYGEADTGGGYQILRYSARSHELIPSTEDQVLFTSTNFFPKGTKLRLYVWSSSGTITLNSTNVPGTTPGTVTIPAYRMLWSGSL